MTNQIRQHLAALKAAGIEFIPRPTRSTAVEVPFEHVAVPEPAAASGPAPGAPAPPSADSPDGRRLALQLLAKEIEPCSKCPELFSTRTQTVFGVGKIEPEICFVGEAPGGDEDRQGEPFVGAAGQLLNKIIAACGFQRDEVYICNILKCRPPSNRTPAPDECENCRGYLERQIDLVKPKAMVALGGVAAKNLLRTSTGIMKLRGKMYQYKGIPLMCTFHPAALLRNENWKRDCWEDMKTLLKELGRPIPETRK